ncbi:MAG TPA: YceI family protein [Gemmatimonadaceae bacterium]|nr:YceI family protein [Gemmatimonadaceae bacterium]
MTTTVWTALVAASALGFFASPVATPRVTGAPTVHLAAGGKPDTLVADPRATTIRWRGTGLGGRGVREGTVGLTNGMLVIRHEQLTSGSFTIDMRSVDGALRGADLLDVARHPTATFRSTGARRVGASRWQVSGDLTMRGITKPITFDTDVRWEEVGHMIAVSTITLDRRQWEIGSGAAIANAVADHDIQLSVSLDARRKQAAVATR